MNAKYPFFIHVWYKKKTLYLTEIKQDQESKGPGTHVSPIFTSKGSELHVHIHISYTDYQNKNTGAHPTMSCCIQYVPT